MGWYRGNLMENRFDLSAAALHILAMAFMLMDHYGMGVLTVFVFCFFHGREWWKLLGQILTLYWLNVQALGGQLRPISAFGAELELCQQGLALLALVPIWLHHGRQGYHGKVFQYVCYSFYPVHMIVLALLTN